MLKGIKVLELAGMGSVTMCGHILKDFGATVTRIINPEASSFIDHLLCAEKANISLNLQNKSERKMMEKLCDEADVLIDPYKPYCLDKLGFPAKLLNKTNPRLILTKISGYGHLSDDSDKKDDYLRQGHDINYLAETGILWLFTGESCSRPIPPANLIADMAGGAFPAALGIVMALYEREKTGVGKIVDVSIADGISYVSTHMFASRQIVDQKMSNSTVASVIWPNISKQCSNLFDGGAPFYRVYKTKDDKYVAVGALEPDFYFNLIKGLGLSPFAAPQYDRIAWPRIAALISGIFATETRDYWISQKEFIRSACISPVYTPEEALANRPSHTLRQMNFSLSPLSGAEKGTFSIQVPIKCPIITDFPIEE